MKYLLSVRFLVEEEESSDSETEENGACCMYGTDMILLTPGSNPESRNQFMVINNNDGEPPARLATISLITSVLNNFPNR